MAGRDDLDEIDLHILRLLQENSRISNAEIARLVALSPPSVLQRIRKLEDSGVIEGYRAQISAEKVGLGIHAWVQIHLSLHEDRAMDRFTKAVHKIPEVLECYHVSGEYDFLLKVTTRSMADYQRLVSNGLATIKGVGKIHTCFVMGTPKTHGGFVID